MKKTFRNEKGMAFLAVILVIVIAVAAGGATFLGVRMAITGDSFFAPFEELGWIDSDDDSEDEEKEEEEVEKNIDKDSVETEAVSSSKTITVSKEAKASGVNHYRMKLGKLLSTGVEAGINVSLEEEKTSSYADEEEIEQMEEVYKILQKELKNKDLSEAIVFDVYAKSDKFVEFDVVVNYETILKLYYNIYKDLVDSDIDMGIELDDTVDSYDDFIQYILSEVSDEEYDSLKDYFNNSDFAELVTDEMDLTEIGFTQEDLEESLKVAADDKNLTIQFTISDDVNDKIWEQLETLLEEIKPYLEELSSEDSDTSEIPDFILNLEISEKSYVDDLVELWNNAIKWLGDNEELVGSLQDGLDEYMSDILKILTLEKVK